MHVSSRLHQTGLGLGAAPTPKEASKQNHGVRIEVRALNLADIWELAYYPSTTR